MIIYFKFVYMEMTDVQAKLFKQISAPFLFFFLLLLFSVSRMLDQMKMTLCKKKKT